MGPDVTAISPFTRHHHGLVLAHGGPTSGATSPEDGGTMRRVPSHISETVDLRKGLRRQRRARRALHDSTTSVECTGLDCAIGRANAFRSTHMCFVGEVVKPSGRPIY